MTHPNRTNRDQRGSGDPPLFEMKTRPFLDLSGFRPPRSQLQLVPSVSVDALSLVSVAWIYGSGRHRSSR